MRVTNNPGDKIRVSVKTDWWNLGGVLLGVFANGDQGDMHWTDGRMFQGMCLFTCTAEFTAANYNESVWIEYRGCDWCFGVHIESVDVVPLGGGRRFTIPPSTTQQLSDIKHFFQYAAVVVPMAGAWCPNSGCSKAVQVATAGLGTLALTIERLGVDPDLPPYDQYADPNWFVSGPESLGLAWVDEDQVGDGSTQWNANAILWKMLYVIQPNGVAAWYAINRSNSCSDYGMDCADWQYQAAVDEIHAIAQTFSEAANHYEWLGWEYTT